jgi:hypothetical protein
MDENLGLASKVMQSVQPVNKVRYEQPTETEMELYRFYMNKGWLSHAIHETASCKQKVRRTKRGGS